jgi:hypothetical protein
MGKNKQKRDDTSDSCPPDAQTKKKTRSSLPSFRMARSSSEVSTSANHRTSRRTTIKKNARGRRGHQTEDRLLIANELEKLPDEAVPLADEAVSDLPLDLQVPDLEQPNYNSETPETPNPTRKRENTTSVRFFFFFSFDMFKLNRSNN